ncbi:MAG: response regulator [Geminicoccaceae bacterium]|jgi:DNA-binding response OmpR family regulator|nr:response regulator [Geminicoccaceae bacterium]MCB9969157.1 response regulator [Geminicoccaceae bacterium]HRY22884.1 response regulator [Geminicoccaceae bacterium]
MARVLVVDDDELLVELVTFTLEGHGHTVLTAEDGADAFEIAVRVRPDVMVLDGMMPGADGLDVLRRLRREAGLDLPVIMLSARKQERDVVGGLAEGASDYLVKPFMPEELAMRIQKALRVPA